MEAIVDDVAEGVAVDREDLIARFEADCPTDSILVYALYDRSQRRTASYGPRRRTDAATSGIGRAVVDWANVMHARRERPACGPLYAPRGCRALERFEFDGGSTRNRPAAAETIRTGAVHRVTIQHIGVTEVRPAAIATWDFGLRAVVETGHAITSGASLLDAVERGVNVVELDASVATVGYGGAPNAAGVMEMDAAVMVGADLSVGAVAGLHRCRRPISVARAVHDHCRHSMLVGSGAAEFARQHGFPEEDALSEGARAAYEEWVATQAPGTVHGHDTLGLCALDATGHLVAACSTSGISFKHPGRVGDSPIVGSGLYADNRAGAAAATGDGDHIQRFCLSFLAVELMRAGATAMEACRQAVQRVLDTPGGPPTREVSLVALSPEGDLGAATLLERFEYAVWNASGAEVRCVVAADS